MTDDDKIRMLIEENSKLRKAGLKLAEAAAHFIREYDGLHRLSLASAEFMTVIGNEFGRGERHKSELE